MHLRSGVPGRSVAALSPIALRPVVGRLGGAPVNLCGGVRLARGASRPWWHRRRTDYRAAVT
eukprot:4784681-Alexandrium_andersonii.AAC.1